MSIADNLASIDTIVIAMMENRSFDHVLGYMMRSRGKAIASAPFPRRSLPMYPTGAPSPCPRPRLSRVDGRPRRPSRK
jgi:hypothetical protein